MMNPQEFPTVETPEVLQEVERKKRIEAHRKQLDSLDNQEAHIRRNLYGLSDEEARLYEVPSKVKILEKKLTKLEAHKNQLDILRDVVGGAATLGQALESITTEERIFREEYEALRRIQEERAVEIQAIEEKVEKRKEEKAVYTHETEGRRKDVFEQATSEYAQTPEKNEDDILFKIICPLKHQLVHLRKM